MAYLAFDRSQDRELLNGTETTRVTAFLRTLIANAYEPPADNCGTGHDMDSLRSQLERLLHSADSTQSVEQRMSNLVPKRIKVRNSVAS
jgi:hypothetical protein